MRVSSVSDWRQRIWKNEKEPTIGEKYFVELSIDMPIERKVRKEDLSSFYLTKLNKKGKITL